MEILWDIGIVLCFIVGMIVCALFPQFFWAFIVILFVLSYFQVSVRQKCNWSAYIFCIAYGILFPFVEKNISNILPVLPVSPFTTLTSVIGFIFALFSTICFQPVVAGFFNLNTALIKKITLYICKNNIDAAKYIAKIVLLSFDGIVACVTIIALFSERWFTLASYVTIGFLALLAANWREKIRPILICDTIFAAIIFGLFLFNIFPLYYFISWICVGRVVFDIVNIMVIASRYKKRKVLAVET